MRKKIVWAIGVIVLFAGIVWAVQMPEKPGVLDTFAQCISDSGAKYYGAFWCPKCKNQEALFGRSKRLLPRIECSTPDGRAQIQTCVDAGITAYPTWVFSDGKKITGTQSTSNLAELTGCKLPDND